MTVSELNRLVTSFRKRRDRGGESLEESRASLTALEAFLPVAEDAIGATVSAGGVPAEWVRAPNVGADVDKALLYLHGGGYCYCGPGTHRLLAYNLSRATGMKCLLLDYRLAPEHPYPAAVEDAVAAYAWLLAQGYDARRLAVAEDSAGGSLTLALVAALHRQGRPLPGALATLSPWTDLTMNGGTIQGLAEADPLVQPINLERCANWYMGDGDRSEPLASPVLSESQEAITAVGTFVNQHIS